jgi:hypothetical protein
MKQILNYGRVTLLGALKRAAISIHQAYGVHEIERAFLGMRVWLLWAMDNGLPPTCGRGVIVDRRMHLDARGALELWIKDDQRRRY